MTELVLVDGSSYLYRAFHALPPLTNAAGEPTGAVYGVVNMLRKLLDERDPHYIGVVFDAPGRTFRDDLFAEYKANRPPMPEDLQSQTDPVKRIVAAMGLPLVEVPGVEADDAIGTLARQAETDGWDVVVSTGDKDMAQLVSERIRLLNTMSGAWLDPDGVREKFGVPPERIIDYLALVGDTSDNIPGVPKVGPKTAAKWLQQYGDLDSLVQQADSVGGKVGENLRAHLEELPLSRDLATIRCDLKLDQRPKDLQRGEPETPRLRELYRHYDFTGWLEDLGGEGGSGDAGSYRMITTRAELDDWLQQLREAPLFAFDLETDSLDYMVANIVGLSFAVAGDAAVYIPVAHDGPGVADQLDRDTVLGVLQPVLEDPEQPKVGQNLKYDMSVLARHGVALGGVAHDTMLQSYVLDSTATRHDMDSLARKYLGRGTIKYETVAGKGAHQIPFNQVGLDEATEYACEDAVITRQLHDVLWPRLGGDPALRSVYETIEVPLLPVLSRMERHGVLVDRALLQTQSRELAERMGELEAAAHEAAGGPFNLGSPKQIQEILYERQGLPVLQKTPKGQPSTAESVLQELAADYELPRLIIEHRAVSKLKSTYTDKLPQMRNPDTGRVHTSYHQAVTATGRLSSSDPNLQNIPVRTEEGRRIRKAFIATPGYRLMAADYSQVELRIMAHLSGDAGLREAFAARRDIHRATAAEVFGADADAVTDEQRRAAKAINFGLIYGMSAWGLARQIGVERSEAQQYVDQYFERFQGVKAYMDRTREQAHEQGYVETVFGRRLHLPEINARNPQRRQYAERTAINAPMQGTAADIIKRAMIRVDEWLQHEQPDVLMVMQVHDELIFEVPADETDRLGEQIRSLMVDAASLDVPLEVDVGVGDNWDEAH